MFKKLVATLFGVSLLAVLAVAGPAGAAGNNGTVYVVHGIPGVSVDVYVNGTKTLPNFAPGKVAGPLSLPAGNYAIKVFKAGANPASATAVIDQSVDLPAGANASLVAGLSAAGKPTLFTFVNDVSAAAAGKGRLAVAHTAAAPAVDVLANGSPAFTGLVNGKEDKTDLAAGTVSASVVAAGTTSPALIGPANVPVTAGTLTVVYAIGAPKTASAASTLGVVTQQIPLAAAPAMVQTGTSGLLDHNNGGIPTWALIGLIAAAAGILSSGAVLIRSRAQAWHDDRGVEEQTIPPPHDDTLMTRRLAIVIATMSVITAIGIGVALMVRSPHVPHLSTLGTITPSTTIAPATTTRERSSHAPPAATYPTVTYPTATTIPPARPPTTIRIPAIGLDAAIVPVGLIPGTDSLQIPDIHHVGWYQLGPSPGQTGSAVLVGHIDGEGQPGIFWHLGQLTPGDQITITDNTDRTQTFRVTGRQQVPKTELPAELFSRAGPPRIALITCGGAFNTTTRHYHDNIIIVATPT